MFSIIWTALMYILCKVGLGGDLHFLTLDDINSDYDGKERTIEKYKKKEIAKSKTPIQHVAEVETQGQRSD